MSTSYVPSTQLNHVKLGSTPSASSWSQAYNAGGLFAVISLTAKTEEEENALNTLGKEIVSKLEEEYFTLEEKSFESIKQALSGIEEKVPMHITHSIIISAIIKNVLYGFIIGSGTILLKRGEKLGALLSAEHSRLQAVSGYLQDNDKIVLESGSFSRLITQESLFSHLSSLKLPEMAEEILPLLHKTDDGSLCALAIEYHGQEEVEEEEIADTEAVINEGAQMKPTEEVDERDEPISEPKPHSSFSMPTPSLPSFKIPFKMPSFSSISHKQKLFISLFIILAIVLVGSIFFAKKQEDDSKRQALFESMYPGALQKYEEGQSLITLNAPLSRDNFTQAEKILKEGQSAFPKGTTEREKTDELLAKVQSSLSEVSGVSEASAKEASSSDSPLLAALLENKNATSAVLNDSVFLLDKTGISSVNNSKKQEVIKNNGDWKNGVGIGRYLTNLYVLDSADGILKYVPSGSEYTKSQYLATDVDLNSANALTLDINVWVLHTDGTIQKFLRGKPESFSITGLDKPLKNPTKIYTDTDTDNLYVLDKGNSRIVVLDKNGAYKAQYQVGILGGAKDFDVREKDKKIFVLSQEKIYQIDLK